ncbi:MAG: hypothetical protein QM770_21410 [Tepidisphaeraceae bacterium]
MNAPSSRHQKFVLTRSLAAPTAPNKDCLGNVSFCDGSAKFFSRKDVLRDRHSGNDSTGPYTSSTVPGFN